MAINAEITKKSGLPSVREIFYRRRCHYIWPYCSRGSWSAHECSLTFDDRQTMEKESGLKQGSRSWGLGVLTQAYGE